MPHSTASTCKCKSPARHDLRLAPEIHCGSCLPEVCMMGPKKYLLQALSQDSSVQGSALVQLADDLSQALPAGLQPILGVRFLAAAYHAGLKPGLPGRALGPACDTAQSIKMLCMQHLAHKVTSRKISELN